MCGTPHLLKRHNSSLSELNIKLECNDVKEELNTKLLGIYFDNHLKWDCHIKNLISSSYSKLSSLRKMKHFTTFHVRKRLAESLIMSRIDYNDHIYSPLTNIQINKLQRLQLSLASFVFGRYVSMKELLSLKWLPIIERRDYSICRLSFKALYNTNWPVINKIQKKISNRRTRSSNEILLERAEIPDTFQQNTSNTFNSLPKSIRHTTNFASFCNQTKPFFLNKATIRFT